MTIWYEIEKAEVPKDGRMYLALSKTDKGVVWWDDKQQVYGWIAEGATFGPDSVELWSEYPDRPKVGRR